MDPFRHLTFLEGGRSNAGSPANPPRDLRRRRPAAAQPELDAEGTAYFSALCARWGLRAHLYRTSVLRRRQAASLRALRAATPRDAMHLIHSDAVASERALGAVMIGVSSFQRDAEVFAALREPMLALHRRRGPLEVMSIGCSNGAELYSVAMLMAEADMLAGARLTGVDCRPGALAIAREGRYSAEAASAIEPIARATCTEQADGAVRMNRALRDACRWVLADVFAWPDTLPSSADVLLCRNLSIYLTDAAAADLWSLLLSKLTPGGLLVVGKAERPSPEVRASCARLARCVYRRLEDR